MILVFAGLGSELNPQVASGDQLRTWDSWDWTLLRPPAPNSPLPFPEGELGI